MSDLPRLPGPASPSRVYPPIATPCSGTSWTMPGVLTDRGRLSAARPVREATHSPTVREWWRRRAGLSLLLLRGATSLVAARSSRRPSATSTRLVPDPGNTVVAPRMRSLPRPAKSRSLRGLPLSRSLPGPRSSPWSAAVALRTLCPLRCSGWYPPPCRGRRRDRRRQMLPQIPFSRARDRRCSPGPRRQRCHRCSGWCHSSSLGRYR